MKRSTHNPQVLRNYLLTTLFLIQSIFIFAQTFQTTIGSILPVNEYGINGLVSNTGDFVILGNNFNHPSGLFNQNGDFQLTWLNNSGYVLNPSRIIGHDVIESAVWFEKAIDCSGNPGYIIAANEFGSLGRTNMLLTFTNLSGIPQWVRRISQFTTDVQSACVKQDGNGNFVLIGTKNDFSTGSSSILVIKTDCGGTLIWEQEYQVGLTAVASSLTTFATFQATCTGLPNEYFITGKAIPPPAGNFTVFILSINATTGANSFLKYYDLAPFTDDIANCIQGFCPSNLTPPGQLFISGYTTDPLDMMDPRKVMMMSTDLSGNLLWANSYNIQNSYREFSTYFQFDADNKIVLTGKAEETGVSDPPETGHCFSMRMNNSGNLVDWCRIYEMGFSSQGNRVELTHSNDYFITGHSFELPAPRQLNYDILAIRTDSLGQTKSACYRSSPVNVITHQPTVQISVSSASSIQSFDTVDLFTKVYADKQYLCPFTACDSLKLNAAFVYSVNGNTVLFSDASTISSGNIISWHWDFGDSNTDTGANPVHTYAGPGNYVVCLIVSAAINGRVCSDSICRDIFISTIPGDRCDIVQLNANFTYSGNGNTYSFSDFSTINSNFTITSWNWDFGDGNFSNLQNPVHTYSSIGNYNVCLSIAGGDAVVTCNDTICKSIKVPYQPKDTCAGNLVLNGGFDVGADPGDLGFNGTSANWQTWTWTPQVVDNEFCKDSFSILMWGNQAVGESMKQAVSFQKNGIYQVSFCGTRLSTPYPDAQARFRAHVGPLGNLSNYFSCTAGTCDEIFLSPVMNGSWVSYISAPWIATQNYDTLSISVWNNYNTQNKAFTSWLRIDDVCIERIGTVSTNDFSNKTNARLYPNPTNDNVTIEFEKNLTEDLHIQVIDIMGKLISTATLPSGKVHFEIPMDKHVSGIYFIRVQNKIKTIWSGKLIKE